jgi:hypothetical protein
MSGYVEPEGHNRFVYWGAWIVLGVFVLIALFSFSSARATRQANEKADQLLTTLQDAGVERLPTKEQIVRVLGDDGGAVCDEPGHALRQATLHTMMSNGAAGPGQRPVIADSRVIQGMVAVLQVYCPDELEDFQERVADFNFDNVIKG